MVTSTKQKMPVAFIIRHIFKPLYESADGHDSYD